MARGGHRKKSGRKPGSTISKKYKRKRITIRLPVILVNWLKRKGNQGRTIEEAMVKHYRLEHLFKIFKKGK